MNTQLASEAQVFFCEALRRAGKNLPKLDFFLYTRGGDTNSVWPLVTLIREHTAFFACLIPFRAHSGGTLICLGADEIVMTDRAELSPIDPTTGNPYNPVDPLAAGQRLGISVEDLAAYITLSKDRFGIQSETCLLEVLKELTGKVHPLALGNVQRTHTQIRFLAKKLLALHKQPFDNKRTEELVNTLTERFYSHLHCISRREIAELLGDEIVKQPSEAEEQLMTALFDQYQELLQLNSTFSLHDALRGSHETELDVIGAVLETQDLSLFHRTRVKVAKRSELPPNIQVQVPPGQPVIVPGFPTGFSIEVLSRGWLENKEAL
jgi:hypothetical protein